MSVKGRLWCAGFPTVSVPKSDTPKPLTLVYPYYCNGDFLNRQVDLWWGFAADLIAQVLLIVVDDGSPTKPAVDVLKQKRAPFATRLYRIEQDIRWNWLAARNIGFHHAPDGWVLVTDMDHVVPAETMRAVIYGQHDPAIVYAFRRREHTGTVVNPHSASFLMTRKMFWTIGGYDEVLSGNYGTDGEYRRRVAQHAPIQILSDYLVRYEYVDDSSTTTYLRKQPEDAAVKRLVSQRKSAWKPLTLSFPYHQEAL